MKLHSSSRQTEHPFMIRIVRFLLIIGVVMSIFALIAGFLGYIHPAFDTFSHMRLHLAVGMIVLSAASLFFSLPRIALICLLCALAGGYSTLNATRIMAITLPASPGKPVHSHFHMNLLWKNADKESVIR